MDAGSRNEFKKQKLPLATAWHLSTEKECLADCRNTCQRTYCLLSSNVKTVNSLQPSPPLLLEVSFKNKHWQLSLDMFSKRELVSSDLIIFGLLCHFRNTNFHNEGSLIFNLFLFGCGFCLFERVSLHSSGWPRSMYVNQVGLEIGIFLRVFCATMPSWKCF